MVQFQGVDVDALFPYQVNGKAAYRKMQLEAITKSLTALVEQNYDVFYIDAPVGFGKSACIITVERVLAELGLSSYYTTPQILLQDQLEEFEDLPQIKGRSNFPCEDDYFDSGLTVGINEWFKKNPGLNCSNAECQVNEKYAKDCPHPCVYNMQRDTCLESYMCGMNIAYMMTVRKELFGQRFLLAVDEAHGVPEWGNGFVSITLKESDLGFIPVFDKGFPAYLMWIEKMIHPKYKARERELKEQLKGFGKTKRKVMLGVMEEYKAIKSLVKKIELLSSDYAENKEEWVFDIVEDVKGKKLVFQPLTSGRFLDKILWSRGKKLLFSSGTISPEIFQEEGGLRNKKFNLKDCVIEVPSEFPPDKSPIFYKPVANLKSNMKAISLPLILKEVETTILNRTDRKGLIHCHSYDNLRYVVANIRSDIKPLLYVQDQNDRVGSLKKWMDIKEPSVFVSVNMNEGLNLKDDLCRYMIYLKVPYPNSLDKRVAKRLELGHWSWYSQQAVEDLEQASGRSTRSIDDWSELFIFDSGFANLYVKHNKMFKKWFKDRLKFIKV